MEEDPSILADSVHSEIKTAMRQTVAHFANKYNIIAQEVKIYIINPMARPKIYLFCDYI